MALRKKHVRRIVFVLLFLLVLGPLAGLVFYGLWLRSGGLDGEVEAILEARLRCRAKVDGVRPKGLSGTIARQVALTWNVGEGRLRLTLENLEAQRNDKGHTWNVSAERGTLELQGPNPTELLTALNHRLVQTDDAFDRIVLDVRNLDLSLDLAAVRISAEGRLVVQPKEMDGTWYVVFDDPRWRPAAVQTPERQRPEPTLWLLLTPTYSRGVFGGLKAYAAGVPTAQFASLFACHPPMPPEASGTWTAVTFINWSALSDERQVHIKGKDLELADWTADVPGGPVTGRAALEVEYHEAGDEAGRLEWRLESEGGGVISAETLRYLEATVPGVRGLGDLFTGTIGYDRLSIRFRGTGDGHGTLAEGEEEPLVTTALFGEEVPLLWATADLFQGRGVLEKLLPALLPSR